MMMRAGVLAVLLAAQAFAQPALEDALGQIAAVRSRLDAAPAGERVALLRQTVALHEKALAAAPNDWRAATWRLDMADAVLRLAGADGSDLSVLFGIPTPGQRITVRGLAEEALKHVEEGARGIDGTVARLESELFAARDNAERAARVSEEIEPRMRALLDVEQAWRVPMLRARAELLVLAAGDQGTGADQRRARAQQVGGALEELQAPDDAGRAACGLLIATAQWLGGRSAEGAELFGRLRADATPGIAEHARLGALATSANLAGARAGVKDVGDIADAPLGLALLRAEVCARALLQRAPADASRPGVQKEALAPLGALVRRVIPVGEGDAVGMLVLEKGAIASEGMPGVWARVEAATLEPSMQYARAAVQVRAPATMEDGLRVMEKLADDTNGPPEVREAALWTWAAASSDKDGLGVPLRLVRLAREFPSSVRAEAALVRADGLLRPRMESRDPETLRLQRELLKLRLARTKDASVVRDLRGVRLANMALDEAWKPSAGDVEMLVAEFPHEPSGAARPADVTNASIVFDRAVTSGDTPERERSARAAVGWAKTYAPKIAPRYAIARAEALIEANKGKDALAQLDEIGPPEKAGVGVVLTNRARLARGRALRSTGDTRGAFETLRLLTEDTDRAPAPGEPGGARPEVFWEAWAEMLEILIADGTTPERTAGIRLHINRLRLVDPGLGGAGMRERIERVSARVK